MKTPDIPADEAQRLATLRNLSILDTATEERFDRLTRLASRVLGVPIALVSLVDENRQWFKSWVGLTVSETPREVSFCGHAILDDDILIVEDALADERFHDNPLVTGAPNIRFYLGCPLSAADGSRLGTLCVIDVQPRSPSAEDLALLRDLARMAEQELAAVQLATMDELTQVSNRRGFDVQVHRALSLCRRTGMPASLLFFDLDRFKAINDRFGHAEGDHALCRFAHVLRSAFRGSDVIGRFGGDEFVVLLTQAVSNDCTSVLARLQRELDELNRASQRGYDLSFSAGWVSFDPMEHLSIDDLLREADHQMYAQKRTRNTGPALLSAAG